MLMILITLPKTSQVMNKCLVVLAGPTAVGKTTLSIKLAQQLKTEIISADARQFYKEIPIGTAAPSAEVLKEVPHHLVGHLSIHDYYNVSLFEKEALKTLDNVFLKSDFALLVGGSGLYIDTLCHGIDEMPEPDPSVRKKVQEVYKNSGLPAIRQWLGKIDPEYHAEVDPANPKRIMRALEVYLSTGEKFSEKRSSKRQERPFRIIRILLNRPRQELFQRINNRVGSMIDEGLIEEMLPLYPYRTLNALNTVGYKELFGWLGGHYTLNEAIEKIRTNTRRYAKRQLTWFNKSGDYVTFCPEEEQRIFDFITNCDT